MLELLLRELNPKHDLDRHVNYDPSSIGSGCKDFGFLFGNIIKSEIRGGLIGVTAGAILGALYSLATNESLSKGFFEDGDIGYKIGIGLDMFQYGARYIYQRLKKDNQYLNNHILGD